MFKQVRLITSKTVYDSTNPYDLDYGTYEYRYHTIRCFAHITGRNRFLDSTSAINDLSWSVKAVCQVRWTDEYYPRSIDIDGIIYEVKSFEIGLFNCTVYAGLAIENSGGII